MIAINQKCKGVKYHIHCLIRKFYSRVPSLKQAQFTLSAEPMGATAYPKTLVFFKCLHYSSRFYVRIWVKQLVTDSCIQVVQYLVHTNWSSTMILLTATDARKSFFDLLKKTNSQHETFEILHKTGKSVMMSSEDYESMEESLYLLSQPGFKEDFQQSTLEADKGELVDFETVFGEPQ